MKRKDPTEFRDRFKRWKEGELVYENGLALPAYEDGYEGYLATLPKNQLNSTDYNQRRYWELNDKPKNFSEAVSKGMFTFEPDGVWHAGSVAYNKNTGEYELMKANNHPTRWRENVEYFLNKDFYDNWKLEKSPLGQYGFDKYVPREKKFGLPKYETGKDPDLTPLDLATMYANNKTYGGDRYIDTTMLRSIDNYMIAKGVGLPLRQAIAYTVLQEGNTTKDHGNGAVGLVGWRGNRAVGLSKTPKGQAAKLYQETYGEFNSDNWNHGGTGSGYNSARDAQKAFKTAKTVQDATKALNYGYVRPPLEDRVNRTKNSSRMFKKFEDGKLPKFYKGLTPYKKSEVNINEATYNPEEDLYTARYTVPEVTVTGDKSKRVYRSHAPRTSGMSKNQYKVLTGDLLGAMTTGMNVLNPSLWWGAVRDANGLQDGFNRLMRGNSGFVTKNFEREHPYVSLAGNIIGDALLTNIASKSADFARALDRGFVNSKNILDQSENTMTRYIGTGDSGYKDALVSDVIRGNMTPPKFSANDLAHIRRRFGKKMLESDFRDLASNNIKSEELFNRINNILRAGSETRKLGRFSLSKNYTLADSWEDYLLQNKEKSERIAEQAYMDAMSRSPEINSWIKNWAISTDPIYPRGHRLPTFALSNEKLGNGLLFPGDYAVQIKNADKYARSATTFGHFAEHPTTYRPMSPFEEDVSMFVRKDGLLTGNKYMVKIPKKKMYADKMKYLQNEGYSANPSLRKGIGVDYNKLMNANTSDINLLNIPIITSDLINYETRSQR